MRKHREMLVGLFVLHSRSHAALSILRPSHQPYRKPENTGLKKAINDWRVNNEIPPLL